MGDTSAHLRGSARDSLRRIEMDVVDCALCPRLREYCWEVARTKRRAFRNETYWGRPVPGFGTSQARLWILGLAPAAHGANRTGRMFTGDSSGDWLFAALYAAGFAKQASSHSRKDGQALRDAFLSAAVRCAPPDNKPSTGEIAACSTYLRREIETLRNLELLLCLGSIAFGAALRLLQDVGYRLPRPRPRFAHAAELRFEPEADTRRRRALRLLASYHPSRQNTQTGRLTQPMWQAVFTRARQLLR